MRTRHDDVISRPLTRQSAIPSIREKPFVGSLGPFSVDRLTFLTQVANSCGDAGIFHLGPFRAVLLNSPDLVRAALVEQEDAFDKGWIFRHVPRSVLGNGLLFSEGDFHDMQRSRLAPMFGPRSIACYAKTIVSATEQAWQTWADYGSIDLDREMGRLALNILNRVLFSEDLFRADDALGRLIVSPRPSLRDVGLGVMMLSLALPIPGSMGVRQAIMEGRARIEQLIRGRRLAGESPDDLIGALMEARDKDRTAMSEQDVRDEALNLFFAGQRNTTDALAWCFSLLAANPEVYANVQAEARMILNGSTPAYADLAQLPFALQVCKEVLRLYPPAYLIGRTALKRVTLGEYELQAGDTVLISPYTIQRRHDYYPEPNRFDPERFAPANEASLPRHSYIPFGLGPRVCIGNHLTLMTMQLVLTTVAGQVNLTFPAGTRLEHEIVFTLRPKRGTRIFVRRRS